MLPRLEFFSIRPGPDGLSLASLAAFQEYIDTIGEAERLTEEIRKLPVEARPEI